MVAFRNESAVAIVFIGGIWVITREILFRPVWQTHLAVGIFVLSMAILSGLLGGYNERNSNN